MVVPRSSFFGSFPVTKALVEACRLHRGNCYTLKMRRRNDNPKTDTAYAVSGFISRFNMAAVKICDQLDNEQALAKVTFFSAFPHRHERTEDTGIRIVR